MALLKQPRELLHRAFQVEFAVVLTGLFLLSGPAEAKKKSPPLPPLTGNAQIQHALNRFTFGPRPGDLETVKRIGLDRWFSQQLHPDKIDDSQLDGRLAAYPAMKLQQADLLKRYPSPQILRQVEAGKIPFPSNPIEAAIYRDGIARIQAAKLKQKQQAVLAIADSSGSVMSQMPSAAMPRETSHILTSDPSAILLLPPSERMAKILAMQPEELGTFRRSLRPAQINTLLTGLSPEQKEILAALNGGSRLVGGEVLATRLLRDVYSERQLQAVMTDFWLNHFNVYAKKDQNEPYLLASYERDVIRPHALGRFEDVLIATARSPAMLVYLDNQQSVGPDSQAAQRRSPYVPASKGRPVGLNENYARELMELHTLGVDGGYTQADVTEVAKVFTGWGIDPIRGSEFTFVERRHQPGSKTVLGKKISEGGEREGLEVLHLLAANPATARFLCRELAVRFVSDTPPQTLVDRMARTYLSKKGDIVKVLESMFRSKEFWSSDLAEGKVKTPLEFVVSAVRATNADIENPFPLVRALENLGMPLYGMPTPNGYAWTSDAWVSTSSLVNRLNFALALSNNRVAGTAIDWPTLVAAGPGAKRDAPTQADTAATVQEALLESLLIGRTVSGQTRSAVLQPASEDRAQLQKQLPPPFRDYEPVSEFLTPTPRTEPVPEVGDRSTASMAGLLLGSPEFQRR